ncbi:MAG: hypothetical protein A2Y33_07420 [Spirochaetes bacterium GWF1_51_8]|nr:MAG: hypothetical protein A2Y33_07420 [Spirochaetes bacterium GWF1_51_8]
MRNEEPGMLLRIFIDEREKYGARPVYEEIVRRARDAGLSCAIASRGIVGYGADKKLHSAKLVELAEDLPVVVEVLDSEEKLEAFIGTLGEVIESGLATLEKARVFRFGK